MLVKCEIPLPIDLGFDFTINLVPVLRLICHTRNEQAFRIPKESKFHITGKFYIVQSGMKCKKKRKKKEKKEKERKKERKKKKKKKRRTEKEKKKKKRKKKKQDLFSYFPFTALIMKNSYHYSFRFV